MQRPQHLRQGCLPDPHPRRSSASALCLVLAASLTSAAAQGEEQPGTAAPDALYPLVFEAGIRSDQEHAIVRKLKAKAAAFFKAGSADFGDENFSNVMFFCPATLAALPLHARMYREESDTRFRRPLMHLDYRQPVPWGEVFDNMGTEALSGLDKSWLVKRMYLHEVARPDGGFRLNFGKVFGDDPVKHPLFHSFQEIQSQPLDARIAARVKQAPIYAMLDLSADAPPSQRQEIFGLFGPRSLKFGAAVSQLGSWVALDAYNGLRPGDGLVGTYLDPKAKQARVLGAPLERLSGVLTANLGRHFSRAMMTAARALPSTPELKEGKLALDEFLDAWTGEVTLMVHTLKPIEGDDASMWDQVDRLGQSLTGTLSFAMEEDAAADTHKDLEDFLRSPASQALDLGHQAIPGTGNEGVAFALAGASKYLAVGSNKHLLTLSVHNSLDGCRKNLNKALSRVDSALPLKKLAVLQGPVRLWAGSDLTSYAHPLALEILKSELRDSEHLQDWLLTTLQEDLLSEGVAISMDWNKRIGTMLRALF